MTEINVIIKDCNLQKNTKQNQDNIQSNYFSKNEKYDQLNKLDSTILFKIVLSRNIHKNDLASFQSLTILQNRLVNEQNNQNKKSNEIVEKLNARFKTKQSEIKQQINSIKDETNHDQNSNSYKDQIKAKDQLASFNSINKDLKPIEILDTLNKNIDLQSIQCKTIGYLQFQTELNPNPNNNTNKYINDKTNIDKFRFDNIKPILFTNNNKSKKNIKVKFNESNTEYISATEYKCPNSNLNDHYRFNSNSNLDRPFLIAENIESLININKQSVFTNHSIKKETINQVLNQNKKNISIVNSEFNKIYSNHQGSSSLSKKINNETKNEFKDTNVIISDRNIESINSNRKLDLKINDQVQPRLIEKLTQEIKDKKKETKLEESNQKINDLNKNFKSTLLKQAKSSIRSSTPNNLLSRNHNN